MRPAFRYYLVQTRTPDPHQQAQRDAPAHAPTPAVTPEGETRHATRSACR
jgi:hypothetical protein